MTKEIIVDVLRGFDEVRSIGQIADEIVRRLAEVRITDEMVENGLAHYSEGGCCGLDTNERREVVRAIIEAAF